jgi:hypothetical protein
MAGISYPLGLHPAVSVLLGVAMVKQRVSHVNCNALGVEEGLGPQWAAAETPNSVRVKMDRGHHGVCWLDY